MKKLILAAFLILASVLFLINEENNLLPLTLKQTIQVEDQTLKGLSIAIAFLAGIVSILSPCTIAVLPAFVSYTLKEKKDIAKMTAVFFAGFALSFITIGLALAYLNKVSFVNFQQDSQGLIAAVGFLLIIFGAMTIIGKGFGLINMKIGTKHDLIGTFLFGAFFSVGWSACTGPIIASILLLASAMNDYAYSAILLFFYALGIAVPLFLMAVFYDKYNLAENKFIKGKEYSFRIAGHEMTIHTTKAIAGTLLIIVGLLFLIYRGTTELTTADLFGRFLLFSLLLLIAYLAYKALSKAISNQNIQRLTMAGLVIAAIAAYKYIDTKFIVTTVGRSEDLDRLILHNPTAFNVVGVLALIIFITALTIHLYKAR